MSQLAKTLKEILAIINQVKFPWRSIRIINMDGRPGYFLEVYYDETDIDTGKMMEQCTRKFYISPYMTETEVVETAFMAISHSMMHATREHFTYMGRRVRSPHFEIGAVIALCDEDCFDSQLPIETAEPDLAKPSCYHDTGKCINHGACNASNGCMYKPDTEK